MKLPKNSVPKGKTNVKDLENEIGDVFFALVNYARFLKINPENALRKTNKKFIKRFNTLKKNYQKTGKKLMNRILKKWINYWNESKTKIFDNMIYRSY